MVRVIESSVSDRMQWFHFAGMILGLFLPSSAGYVPVVFWTDLRIEGCDPNVPIVPAQSMLEFSKSHYFRCLQNANPSTVKIFVTDELDQSDFSTVRYESSKSNAFTFFQNILDAGNSVIMPAVEQSSAASFLSTTLKNAFKGAEFSLIELPKIERGSTLDLQKSIIKLDKKIQEEISQIPPEDDYIAILTASSHPQRTPRSVGGVFVGRQLLATEEVAQQSNKTFVNGSCIYIIYKNLTLTYQKDTWVLTDPSFESTCNEANDTASINMKFSTVNNTEGNDKDVELNLSFLRKQSPVSGDTWWNITSAILKHDLNGTLVSYSMKILDHYQFTAPSNWSWVCEAPDSMTWTAGTKEQPIVQTLDFQTLQMQVFDIKNSSFSRALDCSGFLTAPIWMGTVITILLGIIFAFGMKALLAITTMDRFDDPRGKSIMVHTHESN